MKATTTFLANQKYIDSQTTLLQIQRDLRGVMDRASDTAFTQAPGFTTTPQLTGPYEAIKSCSSTCGDISCHAGETIKDCVVTPSGFSSTASCGKGCTATTFTCVENRISWSCETQGIQGFKIFRSGAAVITTDSTPCDGLVPTSVATTAGGANPMRLFITCCDKNMAITANVSSDPMSTGTVNLVSACKDSPGLSVQVGSLSGTMQRSTCYPGMKSLSVSSVGFDPVSQAEIFQYRVVSENKLATFGGSVGGSFAEAEFFLSAGNTAGSLVTQCQDQRFRR